MKIYILLGHPLNESYNGSIAEAYADRARRAGHEVRMQKLGEMSFNPNLFMGYNEVQALEPDLLEAQQNIIWCEKWVIIYPVWWGSMPAILKGFFDRTLLPGFAFKYHTKGPYWDKLLKGRTAELIVTSDSPSFWLRLKYRNSDIRSIKTATLWFCGFSNIRTYRISSLRDKENQYRNKQTDIILNRIFKP